MLSDEERLAANNGNGIDVAEYRIAAAKGDGQAISSVGHFLAALEAMSLHLQLMESRSHLVARQRARAKGAASLPRINEFGAPAVG